MAYLSSEADVATEVRAILNEPTASFWSDTEITNWVDQGLVDVSSKTMCYEVSATVALATSTLEYTEPTDCIKVYACYYSNVGLLRIHPRMIANIGGGTTTGAPKFYYHFAGKLGFYPIATASENATNVTVLYSAETDVIANVPDEYKHLVVLYAVWKAKIKEGKFAQAAQIHAQYLNQLMFHRQDLYERGVESKDMVKLPDRTVVAGQ